MDQQPLVSALMVTGKNGRLHMAQRAVDSFLAQTYPNKELVIVNDGLYSVLDGTYDGYDNLREIQIPRHFNQTLGDLRNLSMAQAKGEWLIQWDDDDWYAPERIAYQMSACGLGMPTMLNWQTRYSFANDAAFEMQWDGKIPGIPGTICFPRTQKCYRRVNRHEDSYFVQEAFGDVTMVLNNAPDKTPGPELYVRFFHGGNTWNEQHIMREYAEPAYLGQRDVSPATAAVLAEILPSYGVAVDAQA